MHYHVINLLFYSNTDINECETNNGGCAAIATCENVPGTFYCECPAGYDLKDGKDCVGKTSVCLYIETSEE